MKPFKMPEWSQFNIATIFIMILLIPVMLYFLLYVPRQQDTFHKRNLRVLKDLSDQVQSKVENASTLMHNAALDMLRQIEKTDNHQLSAHDYIARNIDLIPEISLIETSLDTTARGQRDSSFIANANNEFKMTAYTRREKGVYNIHFRYEGHFFSGSIQQNVIIHAQGNISDMVTPILNREIYDNVLIIDAKNDIIFQLGDSEFMATHFDSLMDSRGNAIAAQSLHRFSKMKKLQFATIDYKCYFQPVPFFFSLPSSNEKLEWTLCALVDADRFRKETYAISYNFIILFIFLVLFAAISWPLLKLWQMGAHDRYRIADVIFLFLFFIVGSALLTISLMDSHYYFSIRSKFDDQIIDFAAKIESNFQLEMTKAIHQLKNLDNVQSAQPDSVERIRYNILAQNVIPDSLIVYPYFEMVFWTNNTGRQDAKWTVNKTATPLIKVDKREYFKQLRNRQGWYWPGIARGAQPQEFWLQPIYSWTTGTNEAIISIPARSDSNHFRMAALVFRPMSLIQPVVPNGFGFCVLDKQGNTLFHSDTRRNLRENFLRECNNHSLLQSAIFGRNVARLNLNYSGTELRGFIQPIQNTEWSLVTFRNKNFLRTTNLEILTITFTLFIAFILSLLALLGLFRILFPQYNLDWLWPRMELTASYYQLIIFYGILSILYIFAIFHVSATQILIISLIIPSFVMVVSYIKLKIDQQMAEDPTVDSTRFRFHAVRWRGGRAYIMLAFIILLPIIIHGSIRHADWKIATGQTLGLLGLTFAVLYIPLYKLFHSRPTFSHRFWHGTALLCMLILIAILPSIALFHVVSDQETQLMVKNIQYDLGKQFEQHEKRLAQKLDPIAMTTATRATAQNYNDTDALDLYYNFIFHTTIEENHPNVSAVDLSLRSTENELFKIFSHMETIVRFSYDSVSVQTRGLMSQIAEDKTWNSAYVPGHGQLFEYQTKKGDTIFFRSQLPISFFARNPYWLIGFFGLILFLLAILRQVAKRIIFLDFYQPDFYQPHYLAVKDLSTYAFNRSLLMVTPPISGKTKLLIARTDIELINLTSIATTPDWVNQFDYNSIPKDLSKAVVIDHFDFEIDDPEMNHQRVVFLERLVHEFGRPVVLISTVDLSYYFSGDLDEYEQLHSDAEQPHEDWIRWSRILSRFEKVYVEDIGNQVEHQKTVEEFITKTTGCSIDSLKSEHKSRYRLFDIFERECKPNSNLQQVGREIVEQMDCTRLDPEQLIHEIMHRAKSYFQVLWGNCSRDERLVLIHLAEDGLVTSTNAPIVRRLLQRNLIHLDTTVKIMNESFRRFIRSTYKQRDVADEGKDSSWSKVKRPLLIALIAMLSFLFFTQQEFLNDSIALVSTITALLPAIVRIIGLFPSQSMKSANK